MIYSGTNALYAGKAPVAGCKIRINKYVSYRYVSYCGNGGRSTERDQRDKGMLGHREGLQRAQGEKSDH